MLREGKRRAARVPRTYLVLEQILIQQQLGVPTLTKPCHGHLSPPQSGNRPLINKRINERNPRRRGSKQESWYNEPPAGGVTLGP